MYSLRKGGNLENNEDTLLEDVLMFIGLLVVVIVAIILAIAFWPVTLAICAFVILRALAEN